MSKIRITFIASTLDVGGAENVVVSLVTGLSSERFEIESVLLREAGTLGRKLLGAGYRGVERVQRHRADPSVLFRLIGRLRSFSPQIVFMLDHHNALFWGGLASIVAGVPRRVVASHSTRRMSGEKSFNTIDRLFLTSTDQIVALSESHAHYLHREESIDPARLTIIENGIDITRFERVEDGPVLRLRETLGLSAGDRVVMMVAALRPEKAHEALIQAAGGLVTDRPALKFLVVGDGPRRRYLQELTASLQLNEHVRFLGERDDVPELLRVAEVLVLPSHGAVETLPLAVLEAMAAGVPVVASAVGSVPDLIVDGHNGRLIPPADARGLRDAICTILDNRQEAAELVKRGRDTVRAKYTVDRMVSKYEALFERLAI